jgi:uncharacterized membrane protein (UPF0182 family)
MIGLIIFSLYAVFFIPLLIKFMHVGNKKAVNLRDIKIPLIIFIVGEIAVTIFLSLINFDIAFLWFKSLGFLQAFLTRVYWQLILYAVGFFFSWAIYSLFFYVPKRREELESGERIIRLSKIYVPIILAFFSAGGLSGMFMKFLLYMHKAPSSVVDPIFHKSVSFYIFSYPFYSSVVSYLIGIFVVAFIIEEGVYWFYIKQNFHDRSFASKHVTNLLSIVGGILFILIGFKIYLSIFSLLVSSHGAVFGIGFTDYHVRIPLFKFLAYLFFAGGIYLFVYAIFPRFSNRATVIKVLVIGILTGLLLYGFLPAIYQNIVVKPTELAKEKPYLAYNIKGTREGYGLDKIELKQFQDVKPLTMKDVTENPGIVDNVRLWDWRALKDTYQQIQSIRLYYTFKDIDIDRYMVNGEYREVMLAARELEHKLLPADSQSWVNIHLKYTHGYGICMNPVNEFTDDGLPTLYIKDIPPKSTFPNLQVKRPEIYYGETTNDYVIVDTNTPEFDYPKGEDNAYAFYKGSGGVSLGGLNRLIFAIGYNDASIILSRYLTANSRIMIHRNIKDRVKEIAPFLLFDRDPYIVLGKDGKLYWMGDAYTYSDLYPYSQPILAYGKNINYIRNSVKYVLDPYTGKVTFYVIDKTDPVVNTYRNVFPSLFKDVSEMPEFLKEHFRYPDDLMEIQGNIYTVYHMSDPEVFYNKEDKWAIATEKYRDATQQILPYYVIVKNKQSGKYDFVSIYPFTPYGKSNLIALAVAQCDQPDYGKVVVYQFSKDKLFYGPMQIEARIDQDSEISKVLTLWNQQGSEVIRGNLLTLPINDSILYVEPVYLQASASKFPQLKKVILATQTKLVWGNTFNDALSLLFSQYTPPSSGNNKNQTKEELISEAYDHFQKYKEYVSKGQFDLAGKELNILQDILTRLNKGSSKP